MKMQTFLYEPYLFFNWLLIQLFYVYYPTGGLLASVHLFVHLSVNNFLVIASSLRSLVRLFLKLVWDVALGTLLCMQEFGSSPSTNTAILEFTNSSFLNIVTNYLSISSETSGQIFFKTSLGCSSSDQVVQA